MAAIKQTKTKLVQKFVHKSDKIGCLSMQLLIPSRDDANHNVSAHQLP